MEVDLSKQQKEIKAMVLTCVIFLVSLLLQMPSFDALLIESFRRVPIEDFYQIGNESQPYSSKNATLIIEWDSPRSLSTDAVYQNGVLQVNITILAISNASVNVANLIQGVWEPTPLRNRTLEIGESVSEIFTLIRGGNDGLGGFYYTFSVLNEGENATVFFSQQILEKGSLVPSVGFFFTTVFLSIIATTIIVFNRKKKRLG